MTAFILFVVLFSLMCPTKDMPQAELDKVLDAEEEFWNMVEEEEEW